MKFPGQASCNTRRPESSCQWFGAGGLMPEVEPDVPIGLFFGFDVPTSTRRGQRVPPDCISVLPSSALWPSVDRRQGRHLGAHRRLEAATSDHRTTDSLAPSLLWAGCPHPALFGFAAHASRGGGTPPATANRRRQLRLYLRHLRNLPACACLRTSRRQAWPHADRRLVWISSQGSVAGKFRKWIGWGNADTPWPSESDGHSAAPRRQPRLRPNTG